MSNEQRHELQDATNYFWRRTNCAVELGNAEDARVWATRCWGRALDFLSDSVALVELEDLEDFYFDGDNN